MNHRFDNALKGWAQAVAGRINENLEVGEPEARLASKQELPELVSTEHINVKFLFPEFSEGEWRIVLSVDEAELLERLRTESGEQEQNWLQEVLEEESLNWSVELTADFHPSERPNFLGLNNEPVPLSSNLFTLITLPLLVDGERFLEMRAVVPAYLHEELRESKVVAPAEEPAEAVPTDASAVFAPLGEAVRQPMAQELGIVLDVPLELTVVLGRASVMLADLVQLGRGSVLELDKLAGEPVEMYVNDRLVGIAEIVVIDERFGIRVLEMNDGRKPLLLASSRGAA